MRCIGLRFLWVWLCLFLFDDFRFRIGRQEHRKLHLVNTAITAERRRALLLVIPLDTACLEHQTILDGRIQHQEAVVLLVEDVVASVRDLFGAFLVLWSYRLKHNSLFAAGEHFQQVRQDAFHSVEYVRSHHSRAAFFFRAVGLSHVGAASPIPISRNLTIDMVECAAGFLFQKVQQFLLGHFGHVVSQ